MPVPSNSQPTVDSAHYEIRPFSSLGAANHGWLDARHHFSFSSYQDPERMNWGTIRVWNDDRIAPKTGFAPHPHNDMEIITYVRTGAITHRDSLGNEGRTIAGDVQVMSAGRGIRHSEYNLEDEETTLFQIWIDAAKKGVDPAWGTRPFPKSAREGKLVVLASGFALDRDALPIQTPARVLGGTMARGQTLRIEVERGRHAYLVPATGRLAIEGNEIGARDGVAMKAGEYAFDVLEEAELVLVDAA